MAKNRIIENLPKFFALVFISILFYACASIQQPQGGPKDTEPPKVLKLTPKNLTVNFNSPKIVIEFNEYFKVQNESKEFSVSPEMEKPPELKTKGKKLEITIKDSLEKNTTYTLNFGKAIADVNEGNVLKNFTYVFSTGPHLDSLSIKGKVTNSVTGLPELDAVVFVFPLDRDTLFGKKRPSIFTTTDSSGNYSLNNLRKDTYKIYALKEKNGDKIYQQATDEIGFLKDSIVLTKPLDNINLSVFKEDATVFRMLDKKLNPDGSITFVFNQKLIHPQVVVTDPPALDATKLFKFSKNNDSLKVWLKELTFDSVKIAIKEDGKILQTANLTRGKKETYTRVLNATDNIDNRLLNPNKPLKLTFNFPIESTDLNKISLLEDSVERKGFTLVKDSADLLYYYFRYPWKPKKTYDIKFDAGAFTAIFNTKNKEFTKTFQLANKDDYGTLVVKIVPPEPNKSYILEVLNENKGVVNTLVITRDTTVRFANYKAGKYWIRITYDTNKNGKWDTGNVKLGLQPEKIWNEPKELSIRANWERNETITIPKE
ncbi:MAG: Ig-like domain-containing protein [Candidatus Pedobacter colombiensis]|uniref:Ig-like domain-containing protein n=1 Tax=Candidatus Pedobacter colombiensis TaxID=3121371 RepID=A0AAJ5W740_9SPHI|nr:Ig-like domain-containing protein [Pedobacter sp.]WEK19326.1 MAG: Ig-like domain-containing protein [Pedobacter sp.]